MSMHVEWDTAVWASVYGLGPGEDPGDGQLTDRHALVIGGAGGGCVCVEGEPFELRQFARELAEAADRLPGGAADG